MQDTTVKKNGSLVFMKSTVFSDVTTFNAIQMCRSFGYTSFTLQGRM